MVISAIFLAREWVSNKEQKKKGSSLLVFQKKAHGEDQESGRRKDEAKARRKDETKERKRAKT